ncbi:MAG: acyl-CoA synthetase [Sphingopyxis macrogoltabida]|uniref:3-methylmercaptopropionyl-CoA ligase n=1 Tax=Sphingopyxis macrogoltabida TaxID=33050 RepID=A0A2W5L5D1_SPHMC|nr:MAG: acyl-CoA synthetase [Sphingopyxis macrogoltabida]
MAERGGIPHLDGDPNPPSLGDILRIRGEVSATRIAMSFEGRDTCYAEMLADAFRVGRALQAHGMKPDDRIGVLARNSDDFFTLLVGAAMVGAVLVPVNWRLSATEIEYILHDAGIRLLFVDAAFQDLATAAMADLQDAPTMIGMDDGGFSQWFAPYPATDPAVGVSPHDVALQLYTSGTTGHPKGVLLTHHNLNSVRVSQPAEESWAQWVEEDVCLISMPLFHVGGIGTALASLYSGARMIIVREFTPPTLFDFIERDGITRLFIVPTAMRLLLDDPRMAATDFSRLRYIIYGSSPITPDLLEAAMAAFGCPFIQVYGMTETSGTIAALPAEDHAPEAGDRRRSAGRALHGVDIAIIDEQGRPLPAGTVGEIAIRCEANMDGYWRLEAATEEAFTADGYLRSGDAGYLDADGYLYVQDRIKDMIITGGENVYATEVEAVLTAHPAIHEAAVIGVPDDQWGEAVKAFVVTAAGQSVDAADLRAWTRDRLAAYKVPKSVDFVTELPKNASGKVLRKTLRAPYWAEYDRAI